MPKEQINEQIIDGILHFELEGEMVPYCQQALTKMLMESRGHVEHIESIPTDYADPTGCDED